MSKYPHLLSPIQMGEHKLENRVVMAPLTRGRAGPSLTPNELMAVYYTQRASAGLIISEGANAKGWKLVTDRVHEQNGKIFCQLWHTGRASHSSFREGLEGYEGRNGIPIAPSGIKRASEKHLHTPGGTVVEIEQPCEMSAEEIEKLVDEFRNAAKTAKDGGFDIVEIHAASGFLLDNFLQSCSNTRDDEYGGCFENRFRIVDKVLRGVLSVYESTSVGVRIPPNGAYNDMGSEDFREAFLYYAKRFAEYHLGYLHIVIGVDFGFHGKGVPMRLEEFRNVYDGRIIANMGYDGESAEREIREGKVDLVSFGRAFLSNINPDLVERLGNGEELRPMLDGKYWYTSVECLWTSEGYTDLEDFMNSKQRISDGKKQQIS